MINKTLKISRYIQLVVKEALDKPGMAAWMRAVQDNAPSGVVASVQTTDDKGMLRSVCMVHQDLERKHAYRIPLTRDLAPDEVQKIVDAYAATDIENFDIETNVTSMDANARTQISITDEQNIAVCTAMAKSRHEHWMKDRLDAGWRFGTSFSIREKTHPLLRPWEQLPEKFRQPDMESPQAVLDMVQSQGYAIVAKDELERLISKANS